MFAAKLIPEIQRLKRAATPRDSEDIFFTTGPDGFEARLRQKTKPAAPSAPAETAAGGGAYDGMFAVTDATDYSGEAPYAIKVDMAAGIANVVTQFRSIDARSNIAVTANGYLCVDISVNPSTGALSDEVLAKDSNDAVAALANNKGRILAAKLTIENNRLVIEQTQYGYAVSVPVGPCFEEES